MSSDSNAPLLKGIALALCIGLIGVFLVRISGRLITARRTPSGFMHDIRTGGSRILVRGNNAANPLLIFVDDGTLPTLPYARYMDAPLLNTVTVVHFDRTDGSLLPAVIDTLMKLFPGIPYILAGHGAGAANCLVDTAAAGMVLINPPYDAGTTDAGIFSFALDAAKAAYNKQAMCELITTDAKTGTSRCAEGTVGRKWMDKFGGRYFNTGLMGSLRRGLFFNPDLTLKEMLGYYGRNYADVPAPVTVPADSIAVPVLVVAGTHNPDVWLHPTRQFYEKLKADKSFAAMDSAGYAPHMEQPDAFARIIQKALPVK